MPDNAESVAPGGWVWCGYAGHFVASKSCHFHLHTRVGNYRISTVGDYHPDGQKEAKPIGAGPDSLYETYVFVVQGHGQHGEGEVTEWSEVDGERYGTAEEAEKGHMRYCYQYDGKPAPAQIDGPGGGM
jgi:hypothetical protein